MPQKITAQGIRAARSASDKRDRDLADELGIREAQLVAAHVGHHVTRINPHPDAWMAEVPKLGEVMALTRNISCVHERVGTYGEYHSGAHAAMVLGKEIDLRIFAKHWVSAFAIDQETKNGRRRSLQVFDAAGNAVHKIFLRDTSTDSAWDGIVATLRLDEQVDTLAVEAEIPTEPAKAKPEKRDILLEEWAQLTDTHQFARMTAKLGMNRLGAYRLVEGEKWVRALDKSVSEDLFNRVSEARQKVILFVGNPGNIQIHWGTLDTIKPMGPWINVLDPRFNLHLRGDHVAEVYAVEKPTKSGPALSIEAFDQHGMLIYQVFAQRDGDADDLVQWRGIIEALPSATVSA
ncbi:hemin-degrading factor [Roseovarius aestuarii]|nr:hemin-degrading factor [Roseovarius aestuarii]